MDLRLLLLGFGAAAAIWSLFHWRQAVQLVMVLLVFEGAIRKWLFPGAHQAKSGRVPHASASALAQGPTLPPAAYGKAYAQPAPSPPPAPPVWGRRAAVRPAYRRPVSARA